MIDERQEWAKKLISIPIPLRPDFVATLQVPRDLTKRECERIAALVMTLATQEVDDE